MSEVRPQLLITLVHGTWGRGFFLRRQRQSRRPLWFEEGSPFLARISSELSDVPHKIWPLLWTGANSIYIRDKTAQALAEHLSAEHAEHPQATQLIIAHSHGGNIALRALHHLQKRDAAQLCGEESANPFIVTLATPFIEVHHADFGRRPLYIRNAVMIAINSLVVLSVAGLGFISSLSELPELYRLVAAFLSFILIFCCGPFNLWWGRRWIYRRATARQKQVDALRDATQLGELVSAERLLVIRAIDDEASLVLALGAIFNYITAHFITYVVALFVLLSPIPGVVAFVAVDYEFNWTLLVSASNAIAAVYVALIIPLVGTLIVSRSVHGRELAVSPMECQINTQSAPDAVYLSKIVTLVSRTYVKSLRHGIYGNEDCPKAISDWVRSHLCALTVR
jgi:hypothetical protein